MKKYSAICVATVVIALAGSVQAGSFVTRAKVLETKPIIETVYEPYESCSYETRKRQRTRGTNTGEKVIGGLIGGATGSAFGSGSGRDIATGAGALIGSEIADGDGLSEGELIGGLAGGIVGNQVGKGSGKSVATGAGVLIGAIVGDNLQNGGVKQQQSSGAGEKVRVCEQKERAKKVITGYEVTYEYSGLPQTGVLPYEPGEYVDINVGVELVEDRTSRVVN